MPANLENSAVATGLEKSVFIPIPEKGNWKYKSKLQGGKISHSLGWVTIKTPRKTSVGEDVKKQEHLCTIGGKVKWCSCYGNQNVDCPKYER